MSAQHLTVDQAIARIERGKRVAILRLPNAEPWAAFVARVPYDTAAQRLDAAVLAEATDALIYDYVTEEAI